MRHWTKVRFIFGKAFLLWILTVCSFLVSVFLSIRLSQLSSSSSSSSWAFAVVGLPPMIPDHPPKAKNNNHVKKKQDMQQQAKFCLDHRGESGEWILDWDYAKHYQYKTFGVFPKTMIANQLFQASAATDQQPYRIATAYRWHDDLCPISTITRHGFCHVLLHRLNIQRIYVAGDSLTEAFVSSLRGLLGFPKWGSSQFLNRRWSQPCHDNDNVRFINHTYRRVQTPNTDYGAFFRQGSLTETRLDFLLNNDDKVSNGSSNGQNGNNNAGRTAVIVNIGAHVHSMQNFSSSFDSLLNFLDDKLQPRERYFIFFRNTAPGHVNCQPRQPLRQVDWNEWTMVNDQPYRNYQAYLEDKNRMVDQQHQHQQQQPFEWHLFESYNAHVQTVLQQRQRLLTSTTSQHRHRHRIYLLNIYNMTVLRRDGHVGMEDCLHYNLPGPTDWWVHLWYSALLDIATTMEEHNNDGNG